MLAKKGSHMRKWEYSVDECVVVKDHLVIGFTTRTEHWVKFGVLRIPLEELEATVIRSILLAHNRRMEGPETSDTPLSLSWATDE